MTAMAAVMPACSKLTAVPILQRGSIEAGESIPLPAGTGGVRIALHAGLLDRPGAVARVVLGIGAETTEVVFRPHVVHARVGGRSAAHVAIREPIVEEVWLAVSDRTPMRVVGISGELDGPVGVEVFPEALTPPMVLLLSVLMLVVVALVDRGLGLPRNALVAAGAALGFGSLVYWRASAETLGRASLAPLAGGLIAGVGAGSLIRWISGWGGARRKDGPR